MSIWAYIYLLIVFVSGAYSIYSNRSKHFYNCIGEIFSSFSCFALFFIYYDLISIPYTDLVSTLMLLFMAFWSLWSVREHLSFYRQSAEDFAKTVELGENESLEDAILSIKILKIGSLALVALLSAPVFYVYYGIVVGGN
jgi:hypothetical protein